MKIRAICKTCGKEFERQQSNLKQSKNHFCSCSCFTKSRIGKPYQGKKKNIRLLSLVVCSYCHQPIYRWRYSLARSKKIFCGSNCHGKWMSINAVRENAYNWKGGEYTFVIKKLLSNSRYRRLRQMVISIDKSCVLCKSENNLQVHHIIEKFKNPAIVYDITNMVALCKKCHISIRTREEDYVGLFNDIVAKRANSVEPKAKAKVIPNQAEAMPLACVETNGLASKEMI